MRKDYLSDFKPSIFKEAMTTFNIKFTYFKGKTANITKL